MAQKDRAEVRRERKSEITSAPLNAKLCCVNTLYKIYYYCLRMFISGRYIFLRFYCTTQILTSIILNSVANCRYLALILGEQIIIITQNKWT